MLPLAALGSALPSKEDTDEDASLSPLHLIVPVNLRIGFSVEGNYLCLALIYSGATYNFIS